MAKINIGVIGLGAIGCGVHLPGIRKSPDFNLTALCDIDGERLHRVGEEYGVDRSRRFTDYRDLIRCGEVDAVDICTPNDCHYPIARDAAENGKHFAVEKPVTMNAGEARELADLADRKGVKTMSCFSYRFKTAARYARELVQTGMLGDIYHVDCQYFQAWGLPDADAPLFWRYIRERAGSGALGDLGSHALDLARFVVGGEYVKVIGDADTYVTRRRLPDGTGTGISDVDDYCNYLARMEKGISASFQITRFAFGRGNYQRMEVYGSKGALVYKLDEAPGQDELELCIGQPMGERNTYVKVPLPQRCEGDQMQSFADLINGCGDGLAATIHDGLANQQAVDAVIRSFEEEKWISLP